MPHNDTAKKIISNIKKIIIGKDEAIELTLIALLCKGHLLIEDVPGVGKTSLAAALAASLNCSFKRIQFTPDIMPSDITGFSAYNPGAGEFEYKAGAVFSNVVLADEINRTSPKAQSSLLEAMEEKQVTVDGTTYKLPEPFIVIATQNPLEYLGTYPLPEAQMDRFFMRISLGYPEKKEEVKILTGLTDKEKDRAELKPVASASEIIRIQRQVEQIYVDYRLREYIVNIIRSTRDNEYVVLGGSPRASINLYKAAQGKAYADGRDYVIPDDIIDMSLPVVSHRIILRQEAKLKKITQQDIVREAVKATDIPQLTV